MHEYETFVFLDVPKTGTTFIEQVLQRFCTEELICRKTHYAVGSSYDPNKFHFISVRNPLDQFISLYSYGSEKRGRLFKNFVRLGHGSLYDGSWAGFKSWLDFALAPENATALSPSYGSSASGTTCQLIGIQSYRFLSLAVPYPKQLLAKCLTKDAIWEAYTSQKIANFTVRHEQFRLDLSELLSTKLSHAILDLNEALIYIKTEKPINTSDRIDRNLASPRIGTEREKLLREREWLLYEALGIETFDRRHASAVT